MSKMNIGGLSFDTISELLGTPHPSVDQAVDLAVTQALNKLAVRLGVEFIKPEIVYDLKGTTAGWASMRTVNDIKHYTIRLNLAALTNPEYKDYMLRQTIPHEVCHIVEFQLLGHAAHGHAWQGLMLLLNIQPNRTHDLPLPKARQHIKYPHSCECKTHMVGRHVHNKILAGISYHCQDCRTRLQREG